MRAILCVLLLAPSLLAQSGAPRPRSRGNKPKFFLPEEGESKPEEKDAALEEDPLLPDLRRLAGWPSETARRAAERLIVQKEKSRDLVARTVISTAKEATPLKPGCAYVLGYIGEPNHALALILAASEPKQMRKAKVFFEAAFRLDQDRAIGEVFRFFYDSRTTLRRQATAFVRDRVTRKNLPAVMDLLDRKRAERGFTRVIGLTLLDRLIQSDELSWKEGSKRIYRALGDDSPQVARHAMKVLASRNDPDNIKVLNELIVRERGNWRERSYAALSLALLSRAFQVQPYDEESLKLLKGERGLLHNRMLPRSAAAIALAQAALRSGDRKLTRLLDQTVPIILIDSVGASGRHYRDFSTMQSFSYAMLRRITGKNLPDQAPKWVRWWADYGHRFRARRELLEIEPADIPQMTVDMTPPDPRAGSIRITVVAQRPPTFLKGRAYAVSRAEMTVLNDLLVKAEFFKRPESDVKEVGAGAAVIIVRVGTLDRTVAYPAGDEVAKALRDKTVSAVRVLAAQYAWQRWWDLSEQPSWPLFFTTSVRWFNENKNQKAREKRLRSMIAGSLTDLLEIEDRVAAVRAVAAMEGGGGALTAEQAAAFVRAVQRESDANIFVQEVVDLLVPAAGDVVGATLIDALATKVGPGEQVLLRRLCASLPPERLVKLSADTRWKVRRAAVSALAESDAPVAGAVLIARLKDEDVQVRATAVEGLARRRDPALLPSLASLAEDAEERVRASAAYAYALLARRTAHRNLSTLLLSDESPLVRQRAIEGLRESRAEIAPDLLLEVFTAEPETFVRAEAALALVDLETPELVDRLITALRTTRAQDPKRVPLVNVLARMKSNKTVPALQSVLLGDDPVSADAAALGLARRWDETALTTLVTMIKRRRNPRSAVMHLELLTSQTFDAKDFEEQARNYEIWSTVNVSGNPRIWFRDALAERGYDPSVLATWVAGRKGDRVPREAIPLLLEVLNDKEWFLIRNSSMLLNEYIGDEKVAPKQITHLSLPQEQKVSIDAYHDWWLTVREKEKAEERG
ncbi:MAG: HEAT repeat domain-containing protein [Planctomycetota bacterium]|nr:HEAT repeat domain-containing protein [Planctomycetota bacterium]